MSVVPKFLKGPKKKKVFQIRLGKVLFDLILAFVTLTLVPVLIYSATNPQTTPLLWIRWVENDQNDRYTRVFKNWVPSERISPHLIKAVVAAEDQKYFQHRGFDWQAIESAIKVNLTSKRTIGASTISMQTSRNVFLWQGRNFLRKGLESYFTILIENLWSKKRILEVYLNVIEWGKGIYGCDAASRYYFNHSCETLSPVESAWLAAILPNPRVWSIRRPQRHVEKRQVRILNSMAHVRLPPLS